jgi:hypothetical protein
MNYVQLYQAIQDYTESSEQIFVANIPTFVRQAEDRIYNTVQIPSLRKNVTGNLTYGNPYLSLPDDWLANYSLAVIDPGVRYQYLLNKDVNFIREAYPEPLNETSWDVPKYYALFGSQFGNPNELSLLVAPTPGYDYSVEMHYYYYPVSIVQSAVKAGTIGSTSGYANGLYSNVPMTGGSGSGATANVLVSSGLVTSVEINNAGNFYAVGDVLSISVSYVGGNGTDITYTVDVIDNPSGTSWLGDNYDPCLLYGALREAVIFQKGEQDMVSYYEKQFQDAMLQLNRLGTGLERGDAYRNGQAKIAVNP